MTLLYYIILLISKDVPYHLKFLTYFILLKRVWRKKNKIELIRKIPNIKKNSKIQNGSTLKKKTTDKSPALRRGLLLQEKKLQIFIVTYITPTTRYVRYDIKIYMTVINDFRGFFISRSFIVYSEKITGLKYFINFHKNEDHNIWFELSFKHTRLHIW